MSAELGTEGRFARSAAIGPVGQWHVMTLDTAARRTGGWERNTVHSMLRYRRQITDMGMAGTWLTSQVAYGVIVAVFDVGARRRDAPCCDQRLISSQYSRTFHTAASYRTLLIASATSLGRRYTRGSTYTRVLNSGHFLTTKREGRIICGSTYTRVHMVHCNETNTGIIRLHHTYYVSTRSLLLPTELCGLSIGLSHSWARQKWLNHRDAIWVEDLGGPRKPCIRWGPDPPWEGAILRGKERPTVKYKDTLQSSAQKQLNRWWCRLGCGLRLTQGIIN